MNAVILLFTCISLLFSGCALTGWNYHSKKTEDRREVKYVIVLKDFEVSPSIIRGNITRFDYEWLFTSNYLMSGELISIPNDAIAEGTVIIFPPSASPNADWPPGFPNADWPYFGTLKSEPLLLTIYSWPNGNNLRRYLLAGSGRLGVGPWYRIYGTNLIGIVNQFQNDMKIGHKGMAEKLNRLHK